MKDVLRIVQLMSFFVVGWVTTPLMVAGSTDAVRGLVGMLAAIIGAGITGYRYGLEKANEKK
jgi:hypothetical protein